MQAFQHQDMLLSVMVTVMLSAMASVSHHCELGLTALQIVQHAWHIVQHALHIVQHALHIVQHAAHYIQACLWLRQHCSRCGICLQNCLLTLSQDKFCNMFLDLFQICSF